MPKKLWLVAAAFLTAQLAPISIPKTVAADDCPKLRIIFARGSGGERWEDKNFQSFAGWINAKLIATGWNTNNYDFVDLDYPAIGIGIDNIWVALGAFFGAGDSYEFGNSVNSGVKNLVEMTNSCPDTKYVLGGYSQGAMVVSKAIHSIPSDKIIYAATFGDPKLYLPEGKGLFPSACRGENLSDYRAYVPDCRAYEGMLGSYRPYQPMGYEDKLGTWCNKKDIFCSSYLSLNDHLNYASKDEAEDLYKDASKIIASKINETFGISNKYVTEHDTVILIDSTGSMNDLLDKYKTEALRLAKETLDSGGRVALYTYRDLKDGYAPKKGCDFDECTLDLVDKKLNSIEFYGGVDLDESLLGSSLAVMRELEWKYGATKSLVVLTDAGYHEPDYDLKRTTLADVVKMTKQIDPVQIYVVTSEELVDYYHDLTTATGGRAVDINGGLSLMTDEIMGRLDALPRVEEEFDDEEYDNNLPVLEIIGTEDAGEEVRIRFKNTGTRTLVIVNDLPMGLTDAQMVTITGLDRSVANTISLVPLSETRRGETVKVEFVNSTIPKAPNTGRQ